MDLNTGRIISGRCLHIDSAEGSMEAAYEEAWFIRDQYETIPTNPHVLAKLSEGVPQAGRPAACGGGRSSPQGSGDAGPCRGGALGDGLEASWLHYFA